MATVTRNANTIDAMHPERLREEAEALARSLVAQLGGDAADYALGAYRTAYTQLWARFEAMQAFVIPFLTDEDYDGEGVIS
jgi:hypothetical protein